MKREYEELYHRLETRQWWFRTRREIVRDLVLETHPDRTGRILEIGCSGGLLMEQLRADGYRQVTGIDLSADAVDLCRRKGIPDAHVMDAQQPAFADAQFEVITASDVLEHLADEAGALREWFRILKPGGVLIVFVPAFQLLWSEHDEANKHFRRYRRAELRDRLAAQGFRVERASYWNVALFPAVALVRLARRARPHNERAAQEGDLFEPPRLVNMTLTGLLRIENWVMRRGVNFPFGVSAMAVARKPAQP